MQLRPYQNEISSKACQLLEEYNIAYLSMQVRTGKTITAMNAAQLYKANSVLFITKKKAVGSIADDYKKFNPDFEIVIINYESLHKLDDHNFDLIIADEAHCLGAFPDASKRTKELKIIAKDKPIIFLSGTPSPEGYSQLFHQFWVSSFSPFGKINFYAWVKEGFVTVKDKFIYNRTFKDYSTADKQKIDEVVKHLFLSYTQEEAGFEQLVEERVHYVSMSKTTYEMAAKLRRHRVIDIDVKTTIVADTEVKLMMKLHQLYSGSVKPEDGEDTVIVDDSKMRYIFNSLKGQKLAIFYKFIGEKTIMMDFFDKNKILYTESPEEFEANKNKVFISQIQSGREGINLSSADCLVMYNIDFSAVSYWQVRARIQSKNRTKEAIVHWIFAKDGIEPNIYKAVSNKKDYTLNYFKKDENLGR